MLCIEDFKEIKNAKIRIANIEKEIAELAKVAELSKADTIKKTIALEKEMLEYKIAILYGKVQEVIDFIKNCDDLLASQAMHLRFVQGKSWQQTAIALGGGNTSESTRKIVERYLKKAGIERKIK